MMKKWAVLGLIPLAVACGTRGGQKGDPISSDAKFDTLKAHFVESMWAHNPGWATLSGFHKYDSLLVVPDPSSREKIVSWAKAWEDSVAVFKEASLNPPNRTDALMMDNFLRSTQWNLTEFKPWEWDPSQHNLGDMVGFMLSEKYAPLGQRVRNILARLDRAPEFYQAAWAGISRPAKPQTQLAVDQNLGTLAFLEADLSDSLPLAGLSPQELERGKETIAAATAAIHSYVDSLQALLSNPKTDFRDFRIGKEAYEKKFAFDIESNMTAEKAYQKALAHKEEIHKEMKRLTKDLFVYLPISTRQYHDSLEIVRTIIDRISSKHAKPLGFVDSVRKQIPTLISFVKEKDLLYLDPDQPLIVRETPLYMRGVAGASINAPGPYDKGGNTYYNVTPLDGLPDSQSESWLREYNDYILQILNIHEAIPGHYTQLVYANKVPSLIKSIFGNGAMIEGWAVYAERMMLDAGYGGGTPEMWMMYYKWHLRSTCNTILDYSVHCLGMTEKEAMDLLQKEAFQTEAEAKGKWRRVSVTQVQLTSYYTGYQDIMDLRSDVQAKQGKDFNLKKFHEDFLSYGSAPVKHIRNLMLAPVK